MEVTIAMLLIAVVGVGIFQVVLSVRGRSQGSESREAAAQCANALLQLLKPFVASDNSTLAGSPLNGAALPYDTSPAPYNSWALQGNGSTGGGAAHILGGKDSGNKTFLQVYCPNVPSGTAIGYTVFDQPYADNTQCTAANTQQCPKQIQVNLTFTPAKI